MAKDKKDIETIDEELPVEIKHQEVKKENKQIRLVNRNDEDVFVKYYNTEFCISPRGEVVAEENGLTNLPEGVFKLKL